MNMFRRSMPKRVESVPVVIHPDGAINIDANIKVVRK